MNNSKKNSTSKILSEDGANYKVEFKIENNKKRKSLFVCSIDQKHNFHKKDISKKIMFSKILRELIDQSFLKFLEKDLDLTDKQINEVLDSEIDKLFDKESQLVEYFNGTLEQKNFKH